MNTSIKWKQANRGDWVPFVDDRALASTRDPRLEAIRWVQALPRIQENINIAVLGLGAGFHLEELARAFPQAKIYAFEKHAEICEKFRTNFPELLTQVQVVNLGEFDRNPFELVFDSIFHFKSAQQSALSEYKNLYEHLIGVNGRLSIKEIIESLDDSDQRLDARLWRTLREFVK